MPVSVKDAIQRASSALVLDAGALRLGKGRSQGWPLLRKGSLVNEDKAIPYVKSHFDSTPAGPVVEELADYLAVSIWGHAFDGWRYLSQAANSLAHASRGKALHLAYYAELRAAMCILACSGVGLLNNKHYALDASGNVHWFTGSTHVAAWEALSAWSEEQSNALAVVEAVNIDTFLGIPWLELCRTGHSPGDIASHWLKNWSIDLSAASSDREARNEASYRPDLFNDAMVPLNVKDIQTVINASSASLHSVGSGFTEVQAVLVADFCEKSADFLYGTSASKNAQFWRSGLRWMITQHGIPMGEAKDIIGFMHSMEDSSAGRLLKLTDPLKIDAYSVFARAFFLQHLAASLVVAHRKQVDVRAPGGSAAWPDKIMRQYGVLAGLWEKDDEPADRSAIEADVESANDRLLNALSNNQSAWRPRVFLSKNASYLAEITSFERHFVSMAAFT